MKTHLRSLSRVLLLSAATLGLTLGGSAQVSDRAAERQSLPSRDFGRSPRVPDQRAADVAELRREHRVNSDENTIRAKFSDPSKPGTLKVSLPWAEVHVTGTDGNEIVVTSTVEQKGKKEVDQDGFRRLDEDVSFEVVEKNNTATIVMSGDNMWSAHGAEFHVQVPRNTHLVLRTEAGGDVKVENIDGDIDINSMNGEVSLTDIGSSAIINTMNGEVTATFKKAPAKAVSITSMNGEIDLRLPADTKANLRMRTHNGSIRTNFPDGVLQAKTEKSGGARGYTYAYGPTREQTREIARQAERMARDAAKIARAHAGAAARDKDADEDTEDSPAPKAPATPGTTGTPQPAAAPLPPMPGWPGGKSIVGTLNGGGVDIQLSTMNGTITLRQTK